VTRPSGTVPARAAGVSSAPGIAPLLLAGFTTAFGAHSVAAVLGGSLDKDAGLDLLGLGLVLAVYDLAEVLLKPLFGRVSDRIGPKPVIVAGLVAFAVVSLIGAVLVNPVTMILVRFGQGAAASAFSPASSAAVARITDRGRLAGAFGRYGSWKGLGYALGPVLGAGLVLLGGFPLLGVALALVAAGAATWVAVSFPALSPLPRPRSTLMDLLRQRASSSFLRPTLLLAVSAGALSAAVGFLPAVGSRLGLNILLTTAAATVLAVASSLTQPRVGRALDSGRLDRRTGSVLGLTLLVVGIALVAVLPSPWTLYSAALAVGAGVGVLTPLGFSALAAATPPERMGRTMGDAEIGRELGDAGAPALAGLVATPFGLPVGLGVLAASIGLVGLGALVPWRGADGVRSGQSARN
jgi:MFS family permease